MENKLSIESLVPDKRLAIFLGSSMDGIRLDLLEVVSEIKINHIKLYHKIYGCIKKISEK